jgi:hypothetical protein
MTLRTTIVLAAAAIAVGLIGPGTAAAAAGWQQKDLPIPSGYEGGYFSVSTTDGKGDFAGSLYQADGVIEDDMVLWTAGGATVVRSPAHCLHTWPVDENPSGRIAITASGCTYGDQAFAYDRGGFHELTSPDYTHVSAIAVNPAGDVLGNGWTTDPNQPEATLVWPHGTTSAPTVIPNTEPGMKAVDIDDDGAVLFQLANHPAVLRGTNLIPYAAPSSYDIGEATAIRHGVVVGRAYQADYTGSAAFWWPAATSPKALPGATQATDINASGLVVGEEMTWKNGKSAGALPNPYGGTGNARAVGDDGTVVGSIDPDYRTTIPVIWVNASRR